MSQPLIALQLYSLRDETKTDFARTVAEVAEIGYTGVELAGYGNLDAAGANRALRDAGLAVAGMHVLRERLRHEFNQVVEEALLLGTTEIVCPWWPPEEFLSVSVVEQIGRELDEIGSRLHEHGLLLSFHHHRAEFRRLEGKPLLSWLLGAAAPRNLGLELDTYWAHVGDYAPEKFLYEQGERVRLLHMKDEKVIGDGPVNFAPIIEAVQKIGAAEWYIIEQETFDEAPYASLRTSLERLRALLRR
jgi:sugar phosphate isomerase/epimerase